LQHYRRQKVTLGIRPEGLRPMAATAANKSAAPHFIVDVVQHLGHEVLLDASTGSQRIVARVSPADVCAVGERRPFIFDMAQAHLFDAETDANLTLGKKFEE
jgi:multiple sugar transport system ATP-binding protein